MSYDLTTEQFNQVLPPKMRKSVNPELLDSINKTMSDPVMRENFRDNLLSYTSVMANGKFKMDQYINAVKYVSFKLLGATNIAAYTRAFPDRYQGLVNRGASAKDISAYVPAYSHNKLVTLILEQTLIPTHIVNADLYQKGINVLADLMVNANSEKVRSDCANNLLTQLKPPEIKKIELDIGIKEDRSIQELRETTMELAAQQRKMIQSGMSDARDVAHSTVIIGESDVVEVQ